MPSPMPLFRFQVNKHVAVALRAGHPWIFRKSCSSALAALSVGCLVRIVGPDNTFLGIGMYEPLSAVAIRVFCWEDRDVTEDYFLGNLQRAYVKRFKGAIKGGWSEASLSNGKRMSGYRRPHLISFRACERETAEEQDPPNEYDNAFRLIHGEADGFPGLVVDIFADIAVVVFYLEGWQEHVRAPLVEFAKTLGLRALYVKPAHGNSVLSSRAQHGDLKRLPRRFAPRNDTDLVLFNLMSGKFESVAEPIWFEESEHRYSAYPATGLKTGFFLDLRAVRTLLPTLVARGDRVLNLFANDGVLSALVCEAGAQQVISVERHAASLVHAKTLFEAWKLSFQTADWHIEDVWTFLKQEGSKTLNGVIVDPPSLASKRTHTQQLETTWTYLHRKAVERVKAGGWLLSISCTERMTRDEQSAWTRQAAKLVGRQLALERELPVPFDHPELPILKERHYFRAWVWRVKG